MQTEGAVLAVVQARMSSSRLPGKVLAPILGRPMILRQLERIGRAETLDAVVVATSVEPSDDPLADALAAAGVAAHRGPLDDVLARFGEAVAAFEAAQGPVAHVVRLTGDCPLIDPALIDAAIRRHVDSGADYTSNAFDRSYPDGLDVEVATRGTLERLMRECAAPEEREHVTLGLARRRGAFRVEQLVQPVDQSRLRWTVDTPDDLAFARRVYAALYPENPAFSSQDVHALGPDFVRLAD
ncbi:MAG: glycosyltransferase family protein [Pseudomonadota bacterium]